MVELTLYYIFYEIVQTRIPTLNDFAGVSTFTDEYLNNYFAVVLSSFPDIEFVGAKTIAEGSEFRLQQPVRVDYNTTLTFSAESMIPEMAELDVLLASAFEGDNGRSYAFVVSQGVDESNIFSTTSGVTYQLSPIFGSQRVGIFAGLGVYTFNAAALILVVFGMYRLRQRGQTNDDLEKSPSHLVDHITLASSSFHDDATFGSVPSFTSNHSGTSFTWSRANGLKSRRSSSRLAKFNPDSSDDDDSQESPEQRRKRLDEISF